MARENLANGIPVGLGTDTGCPYITHYDMWRELCYFVKYCGVTPAFALHTATLLNARLAGIDGETGSIEAGKAADLIVCAKDRSRISRPCARSPWSSRAAIALSIPRRRSCQRSSASWISSCDPYLL